METLRNLFGGEGGSNAMVIRFGLFGPTLHLIFIGGIAFTTCESIHNIDAIEAGMLSAIEHGWDEPNGQNIANTAISVSGVSSLRPTVSLYCGCPTKEGIVKTGDPAPCAAQFRCAEGNIQGQYVEVSAVFTPTLAKLVSVPWPLTEKVVTRLRQLLIGASCRYAWP
jgi:hypothetical protein